MSKYTRVAIDRRFRRNIPVTDRRVPDLVGRRFGRLRVLARAPNNHRPGSRWYCWCDCGGDKVVARTELTKGVTSSCGCLQREAIGARNRTHGRSKDKVYAMLRAARTRADLEGLPFDIGFEDLVIPSVCPVLGIPMEFGGLRSPYTPSLDRIIPLLGYTKGNVRVISWRANKLKSDATLFEIERIALYMKGAI